MAEISCMWFPTNGNSLAVFCSVFSDTWQPFDKGRTIIFPRVSRLHLKNLSAETTPAMRDLGNFFTVVCTISGG